MVKNRQEIEELKQSAKKVGAAFKEDGIETGREWKSFGKTISGMAKETAQNTSSRFKD